jgi:hypothetical protein
LPLPQVWELFHYWAKHPPVHELLAAFLGVKPKGAPETDGQGQGMEELMRTFPVHKVKR